MNAEYDVVLLPPVAKECFNCLNARYCRGVEAAFACVEEKKSCCQIPLLYHVVKSLFLCGLESKSIFYFDYRTFNYKLARGGGAPVVGAADEL